MSYPPGQQLNVVNNGLGLTDSGGTFPIVVGATSGGTAGLTYWSDPNALVAALGDGPAVELALAVIPRAGGVGVLKTATSVAASNTSVTATATGTGTVTVAGSARMPYRAIVNIVSAGTLGAGKFQYSLDGGYTYSESYTIPAGGTYTIPRSGLTLTFVPGAGPSYFAVGDSHVFTSVAAHYNVTDLGNGITALLAQIGKRGIKQIFFAGQAATASASATIAAAIATYGQQLASKDYFVRMRMDMGNDTPTNAQTSFATFADDRVACHYGQADLVSLNTGVVGFAIPRVSIMNVVAERSAGNDLSENAGRVASGPLRGVRAITHDEAQVLAFSEADRVTTLRTYQGGQNTGYYVLNDYLKSSSVSDFKYYAWGKVIDVICDAVVASQNAWILAVLRSLTDGSGNMDPLDAARIESMVKAAIKAVVVDPRTIEGTKGHVSGTPSYKVDTTTNFLGTGIFNSTCSAVPVRAVEGIVTNIGFARSTT